MTAPRQVLPGTTYLVTRRCSQRQFLLRPSKATNQIIGFVLALAAKRFEVQVHAVCVMSNHFHLVVTDSSARLPAFGQYLDSLVGRAMNRLLGRQEAFWGPSSYSAVALVQPTDVVDKIAYVLANPVMARLARRGRDWAGLWSEPGRSGVMATEFHRPARFFRSSGPRALPERVELATVVPPGFDTPESFRTCLAVALSKMDRRAARGQGNGAPRSVGPRDATRPIRAPNPGSPGARTGIRPRIACLDKWGRIEALGRLVAFLRAYRCALAKWRAGDGRVVFPAGTYLMRVSHGVTCRAPG